MEILEGQSTTLEQIAPELNIFLCNVFNILNLRYTDADINVILQPVLLVLDQIVKYLAADVCIDACCEPNIALIVQSRESLRDTSSITFVELDEVINNLLRYLLCLLHSLLALTCPF